MMSGIVADKNTSEPIENAHVLLSNSSLGAITDHNGHFAFSAFPQGRQLITISSIGYVTVELVVQSGEKAIHILLEPSSIILNNSITVTAQRSERLSFDVSQSIATLTSDQLSEKSSRSAPEALMNEAGIWVQKTNHGSGSPIIRGLVGNQILLMVDGIRLNNATYRYGPNQYLSTIDPGMIGRIEAIRGSGSVLYGSDALGGVVHILSKSPHFSERLKASGNVTAKWMSAGMEKSTRAEVEIASKKMALAGGFSARNSGDLLAGGMLGVLDPTGYNEQSGDVKLLIRTDSSGMFTAAFQQLTQHDVPRYDQVVQGGYAMYNFEPQTRQLSYVRWETFSRNPWIQSFRITASLNRAIEGIHSQRNNSSDVKTQRDEVNTTGIIAEVISAPISQWNIQSGVEYYFDKVNSTASTLNLSSNTETIQRGSYADGSTASSIALFTNHQYNINKFQFSAGARFNGVTVSVNDNTFGDQKITPKSLVGNLGVMMKVNNTLHAFVTTNTGFRAPNVDDMSKFGTVESGVFEIPSAGLSPEKSKSVETGLKFRDKKFSATLSLYQTNLSDLIDRVPAVYKGMTTYEGRNVYQKQNVGEARLRGFEAEMDIQLMKSVSASGHVTYTHGMNITRQEPMRRIPPLFGRIGLRYQHAAGLWIKAELAAAGKQDRLAAGDKSDVRISIRLEDGVMPSWNIVNLYAGYSYKFISVHVIGQNLLNRAYRIYASGVDGYGRSMGASLNIRF